MGSPVSAVIANLVMEKIENDILKSILFRIALYKRYVDDILLCLHKSEVDEVLKYFNKYHPKIQFTLEEEVNSKINFLDVSITHTDGKVYTSWFTKPTSSGLYTNFLSVQPFAQKRNVIQNLSHRLFSFVLDITH